MVSPVYSSRLMKRASSLLASPPESIEEVGERRVLAKLMDNASHPLHETVEAPERLLQQ